MVTPASLYIFRSFLKVSIETLVRQAFSFAACSCCAANCSGVASPRPRPPPPPPAGPPPPPGAGITHSWPFHVARSVGAPGPGSMPHSACPSRRTPCTAVLCVSRPRGRHGFQQLVGRQASAGTIRDRAAGRDQPHLRTNGLGRLDGASRLRRRRIQRGEPETEPENERPSERAPVHAAATAARCTAGTASP